MNHPLGKFHRPRFGVGLRDSARGQTPSHRVPGGLRPSGQTTFAEGLPGLPRAKNTAPRRRTEVHPANAPHPSKEKHRLRWYQFSLRTLFWLTLVVSLLMSWHAVKVKKAAAQKKAVETILAEGGTVEYDYQFDEQGQAIKGAKGRGPAWLRDLLGPDYFDTVVYVQVVSAQGMEGVNGLVRLRSLCIDVPREGEDPLKHLQDIDGLEELDIAGRLTDTSLNQLRGLRHIRRLTLTWRRSVDDAQEQKPITGSGLAALQECPALRELTIQAYELPTAALEQIEALSQLEKLTVIVGKSRAPLVFHINKLPALRELELSDRWGDTEGNSTLIVAGIEEMQNASRLERLHLSSNNLTNSDVMGLSTLTSLRDLDLSGCSRVNDRAVPFLRKIASLRRLTLENTGMSDDGAEQIDDALPNCRVIY